MKNVIFVIFSILFSHFLIGQPTALGISVQKMMEDLEIPGMSIAVMKGGELVYSESLGYADVRKKKEVNSETMFRMASVSKLFAAGAIAKLVDEDKVHLSDPVEMYIPGFPNAGRGVTIKRVLNHTSGIRHYGKGDRFIDAKNYETTRDALKIFMEDELLSQPGETYKYSTHAYTLLAAVVEKVTGMSYTDYLDTAFFAPLEMNRSRPDVKGQEDENQSSLYKDLKKVKMVDNASYKRAGGGMLSTAQDLVKFGRIHIEAGFFKQNTLDSIFSPSMEMPGTLISTSVGMGWRISRDSRGEVVYHHAGSMSGARSFLMLSPADDMVVAVMTNNRNLDFIDHFGIAIRDAIKGLSSEISKQFSLGEKCNIDLKSNGLYYTLRLTIPELFDESVDMKLVAHSSLEGVVLKNLKVTREVLYMELSSEKLIIYVKDEAGKWVMREYEK